MAKVSTNINLDPVLKKDAQILLKDLGMDLTTAVTIFLRQAVREQRIPFEIKRELPNAETKAALQEARDILSGKIPAKSYGSARELFADLDLEAE